MDASVSVRTAETAELDDARAHGPTIGTRSLARWKHSCRSPHPWTRSLSDATLALLRFQTPYGISTWIPQSMSEP